MSKEVMLQDCSEEAFPDILKVYKQVFVLSHKFVSCQTWSMEWGIELISLEFIH